ncbi:glycosyltransferase family 4 protein [Candidatus Peregrinibacteria bacterium]|nr:glycosyltransferase family 4 protein [Candidatus Peregrinibacteria bacterium]
MRIGIDCRFAATPSGLGRYTRELVTHLLKRSDGIEYVLFVHSQNEVWLPKNCILKIADFPHYSIREQIYFPGIIKQSSIDFFLSPHFNVPLRCSIPFIVTIHDLILHEFPHEALLWKRLAYRWQMNHAIRNSDHIIAVSEYTANDIRKHYGDRHISVIHEGVQSSFSPKSSEEQQRVLQKYNIKKSFFLYVGSNKDHKNVPLLKKAAHLSGVSLLCIPESIGTVPDHDLPALYSASTAFVTASLAEGFCLPAVEALACGCPVIASNCGAIPEVTKGHATLIEPTVNAFTQAMKNPPPRPSPIRLYDWQNAAQKTAAILVAHRSVGGAARRFPSPF